MRHYQVKYLIRYKKKKKNTRNGSIGNELISLNLQIKIMLEHTQTLCWQINVKPNKRIKKHTHIGDELSFKKLR